MTRFNRRFDISRTAYGVLGVYAVVILALIGGWIANIVKLTDLLNGPITTMFITRVAGVIVAPLGVVLGYFF